MCGRYGQKGTRVLYENDQVRLPGTEKWYLLGKVPQLAVYLPRAEPLRSDDQAEALEPVEVEFSWRPHHGDEDDDVEEEAARLEGIGARRVRAVEDWVTLADPVGNLVCVVPRDEGTA